MGYLISICLIVVSLVCNPRFYCITSTHISFIFQKFLIYSYLYKTVLHGQKSLIALDKGCDKIAEKIFQKVRKIYLGKC